VCTENLIRVDDVKKSPRRLDQEQASDHGLAIVGDQGAGHRDRDSEARGIRQERLVRIVIGKPGRQRARPVEGVNCKQHDVSGTVV
jgi:hypothetical protein